MKYLMVFIAVFSLSIVACKKKEGCTDSTAVNFNSDAEKDDGSCIANVNPTDSSGTDTSAVDTTRNSTPINRTPIDSLPKDTDRPIDKDTTVKDTAKPSLPVITDSSSYKLDTMSLNTKHRNIVLLSKKHRCSDASQWKFTAIGAKGCGGPTGFIAYSTMLDERLFLEKVKHYTEQQKKFNQKWGIASDCSVPIAPSKVECKDGVPTFEYNLR